VLTTPGTFALWALPRQVCHLRRDLARRTAIVLLLLLVSVDSGRPSFQAVLHFELAFLTHKEALELNGRRIVCRVDLDSLPDEHDDHTAYDCAGPDNTYRTVWLRGGEDAEDTMTVEATLRLRYVPLGRASTGSGNTDWWMRCGDEALPKQGGQRWTRSSTSSARSAAGGYAAA
jgi:hypothetical protein